MEHRKHRQRNQGVDTLTESEKRDLLEIYRLHAELADKVSQRREGANRLYVSLISGLILFAGGLFRFNITHEYWKIDLISVSILGLLLSGSWYIVIRSYRQLNTGKFKALHELEEQLSYPFFQREWLLLGEGKDRRYWKLTIVETFLPLIFGGLFCVLLVYSVTF